jgi:hypothetical protein
MSSHTFNALKEWLQDQGNLHDSRLMIEEKIAIFIAITGHGWSY